MIIRKAFFCVSLWHFCVSFNILEFVRLAIFLLITKNVFSVFALFTFFFYVNTKLCFLKGILKGVLDSRFFLRFFFLKKLFFWCFCISAIGVFCYQQKKAFPVFCEIFSSFCDKQFSHGNAEFCFLKP